VVEVTAPKTSAIITLAAIVVIVAGMKAASAIIVPFMIAAFLALITVRPMLWLQANRVPTVLAALLIVLTILAALTVVGVVVGRSLAAFTAALPDYQQQLQGLIDGVVSFLAQYTDSGQSIERVGDLINPGWAMGLAATLLNAVRDIMTNTLLITFTVIFILLEASSFPTKITAAFGESARSLTGARQFLDDLGRYLGIKTLVSIITGLLVWALTFWLGLDFPRLWGMLAFLLNYIPLIVFVGLIFWGWVFGPVGMLLSVPLSMTLKLALESNDRTRWVAIFIGSQRDAQHTLAAEEEEAQA
jgi:AI-2 transport protein TqsA